MMEEKYQFVNYDREIDTLNGEKIELMDLYKDKCMYAVRIYSDYMVKLLGGVRLPRVLS